MSAIVSVVFHVILFPLDGRIGIVDNFFFCTLYYAPLPSESLPLVGGIPNSYVNIGTSLLKDSSMMGCAPLPLPTVP